MADLALPRRGRSLTPEEFAALLAGGPTYSDPSMPDVGPYGTGSNRGREIPTSPMGGLFAPAFGGPVTQNPSLPAAPEPPSVGTSPAETAMERCLQAGNSYEACSTRNAIANQLAQQNLGSGPGNDPGAVTPGDPISIAPPVADPNAPPVDTPAPPPRGEPPRGEPPRGEPPEAPPRGEPPAPPPEAPPEAPPPAVAPDQDPGLTGKSDNPDAVTYGPTPSSVAPAAPVTGVPATDPLGNPLGWGLEGPNVNVGKDQSQPTFDTSPQDTRGSVTNPIGVPTISVTPTDDPASPFAGPAIGEKGNPAFGPAAPIGPQAPQAPAPPSVTLGDPALEGLTPAQKAEALNPDNPQFAPPAQPSLAPAPAVAPPATPDAVMAEQAQQQAIAPAMDAMNSNIGFQNQNMQAAMDAIAANAGKGQTSTGIPSMAISLAAQLAALYGTPDAVVAMAPDDEAAAALAGVQGLTGYGDPGAPEGGGIGFGEGTIGAPGAGVGPASEGGQGFGEGASGIAGGIGEGTGFGGGFGGAIGGLGASASQGGTGNVGASPAGGSGSATVGAPGQGTADGFGVGATGIAGTTGTGDLGGGLGFGGLGGGLGGTGGEGLGGAVGGGTGEGATGGSTGGQGSPGSGGEGW